MPKHSERRKASRTNQADEATMSLLASLVDSSDDAIISKTPTGIITSWNRAAELMYGWTAQEIIGRHISVLTVPDRREEIDTILARVRSGERVEHYETVRVRKDGALFDVSLTVSPIRDSIGALIGVSTIARDITERKLAEEQARAALLYARSLIEASLDPLVTISPEGKVTDVNEATVRATGVPRASLVGTDFSDYFTEPGRARRRIPGGLLAGLRDRLSADHPPSRCQPHGCALQCLRLSGHARRGAWGLRGGTRRDGSTAGRAVRPQLDRS